METKTVKIEIEKNKIITVEAKQLGNIEMVEYKGYWYKISRLNRKKEPIYALFTLGN
jgi:lipocalin